MRPPFVDSASFLSGGPQEIGPEARRQPFRSTWLLTLALVMAVAACSAVLLAL